MFFCQGLEMLALAHSLLRSIFKLLIQLLNLALMVHQLSTQEAFDLLITALLELQTQMVVRLIVALRNDPKKSLT
jgi:hypothetical protein